MADPKKISQFDVAQTFSEGDFLSGIQQVAPSEYKNVKIPHSAMLGISSEMFELVDNDGNPYIKAKLDLLGEKAITAYATGTLGNDVWKDMPIATTDSLGGIMVGDHLTITPEGKLSVVAENLGLNESAIINLVNSSTAINVYDSKRLGGKLPTDYSLATHTHFNHTAGAGLTGNAYNGDAAVEWGVSPTIITQLNQLSTMFELVPNSGNPYIKAKLDLLGQKGITAYATGTLGNDIWADLPVATDVTLGGVKVSPGSGLKMNIDQLEIDGDTFNLSNYYTKEVSDGRYSQIGHTHTFASLTSKPTTLAGFGITDAYTQSQVNTELNKKYDKTGGLISGNVSISGNLTVTGTQFFADTQTVRIKDNLSIINYGETGAGITAGFAGWEADRGTLSNYKWGYDEARDLWVLGEKGSTLQAVATREDNPTNGGFAKWNNTAQRFDTELLYSKTEISNLLATKVNKAGDTITGVIRFQDDVLFDQSNSSTEGIKWKLPAYSKFSAAILPIDNSYYARCGIGFYTGDAADATTDASLRMAILRNGGVAINKSEVTPGFKLDVNGNLIVSGNIVASGAITAYASGSLGDIWSEMPAATATTLGGVKVSPGSGLVMNGEQLEIDGDTFNLANFYTKTNIDAFFAGTTAKTGYNKSNWDAAYTDRLKWNGGSTGLNATTGRTSLGLGTAATLDAQTSSTDTTTGRLMQVGAFGLGEAGVNSPIIESYNQYIPAGFYSKNPANTEGPYNTASVIVSRYNKNVVHYLAFDVNNTIASASINTQYGEGRVGWAQLLTDKNQLALGTTASSARTAIELTGNVSTHSHNFLENIDETAGNKYINFNFTKTTVSDGKKTAVQCFRNTYSSEPLFLVHRGDNTYNPNISLAGNGDSCIGALSGGLAIGKTTVTSGYKLDVNGSIKATGNILATGEVTAYTASDKRLKKNIKPLNNALEIVSKLNPVTYNWNAKAVDLNGNKDMTGVNYGLIAQELEQIVPDLIRPIYGDFKTYDDRGLMTIMLKAIKELKEEIDTLKNK